MISSYTFFRIYYAEVFSNGHDFVTRKTEYASGNAMNLLIEFLFVCHASLNNLVVQLFMWLRIFVSATLWSVSTQCDVKRGAFTLRFFIAARCSLILVASFLEVCSV